MLSKWPCCQWWRPPSGTSAGRSMWSSSGWILLQGFKWINLKSHLDYKSCDWEEGQEQHVHHVHPLAWAACASSAYMHVHVNVHVYVHVHHVHPLAWNHVTLLGGHWTLSGCWTCFGDRVHWEDSNLDEGGPCYSPWIGGFWPGEKYSFRENNLEKPSPGVISQFQRTNTTSHPFHSTLQCARGQSFYEEQLIWFSLYISFPGRVHLLSGDRKHMTSLDGLGEERRFLTSQLWRNPLSAA